MTPETTGRARGSYWITTFGLPMKKAGFRAEWPGILENLVMPLENR